MVRDHYAMSEGGSQYQSITACACPLCRHSAAAERRTGYGEENDRAFTTGRVVSSLEGAASSGDYEVDCLVAGLASRWNFTQPVGSPASVTYSFMTAVPSYEQDVTNFQAFTDTMKAAAVSALAAWASVTNLVFTEVSDSGSGGQIRFGSNFQQNSAGYAYYPSTAETGGDIWIANNVTENLTPSVGTNGYLTLLHEIGHALGLKHPGNYDAGGGGTEGPYLDSSVDNTGNTVMSYTDSSPLPSGLGPYDIDAIRYLYGFTGSGQIGNLIYGDDNAAAYTMTGGAVFAKGGNDTIVGSSGNDGMMGGAGSDLMSGGAGNDLIYGNTNTDVIYGGEGADTIFGGQNDGTARLDAFGNLRMQDGVETLYGGAGGDVIYGNFGNEIIFGGAGDDLIYAGQNEDTVSGGAGNDTILGNRDNDTLNGGDGSDIFRFSSNSGADVIEDFNTAFDALFIDANVNGSGIAAAADVISRTVDIDGNAVIDLGSGNSITLTGLSSGSLSAASIFVVI